MFSLASDHVFEQKTSKSNPVKKKTKRKKFSFKKKKKHINLDKLQLIIGKIGSLLKLNNQLRAK